MGWGLTLSGMLEGPEMLATQQKGTSDMNQTGSAINSQCRCEGAELLMTVPAASLWMSCRGRMARA